MPTVIWSLRLRSGAGEGAKAEAMEVKRGKGSKKINIYLVHPKPKNFYSKLKPMNLSF